MRFEVTCTNMECESVVPNAYGEGNHFRHVMLAEGKTVCPVCSAPTNLIRMAPEDHKFALGSINVTPGTATLFDGRAHEMQALIQRHVRGDYGTISAGDITVNEEAIGKEDDPTMRRRILSSYEVPKTDEPGTRTVWIITEAGRHATTVLLPEEY